MMTMTMMRTMCKKGPRSAILASAVFSHISGDSGKTTLSGFYTSDTLIYGVYDDLIFLFFLPYL